jgi:phosphoserine phosphatase
VLHRAKITEQIIESERLDREISVARDVQIGTLPKEMPKIDGYQFAGAFEPTDQTGGDLYDFIPLDDERLFMLMGDATGHGIGPALSATQVRAMLRVSLRLNASLDDAFTQINDQLCDDLPDDRFVTGFFGLLDARTHSVRFHSGGQGPILHYHSLSGEYDWHPATTFPLGYMPQVNLADALDVQLAPGDVLGLISDGIYEYEDDAGVQFGQAGVAAVIESMPDGSAEDLVSGILEAVRNHAGSVPQADDITIVLARRSQV